MEYLSPKTLNELIELATKYGSEAAIVSGCTDLLVKKGYFDTKKAIIDINTVEGLKNIEDLGDKIRIGARVTFSEIKNSDIVNKHNKALIEASRVCGSVQIRNRATIAGNIINASPAADSIPALMVSNAMINLHSSKGNEYVSIKNFFTGPGKTILKQGQIITHIEFDKNKPGDISFYRKIGTRKALSIAKASVAFKANKINGNLKNVEIAYGSVGPTVISSKKAKEYLEDKPLNKETIQEVSKLAFEEVSPIDDIRSTAEYRRLVIRNVLIEELRQFI